jgi:hypothetical protein
MSKKFSEEFSVFKDANGEFHPSQDKDKSLTEVKLKVRRPTHLEKQAADFEYNKQMNKLLKDGIMPKVKLNEVIKSNGIWDEEKEAEEKALVEFVNKANEKLEKGKIKLSEAEKLAKDAIKKRFDLIRLTADKNETLQNSADSIAENYRFNYLVSNCTVYNDDVSSPYFKGYEDFLRQDNVGNPVPWLAGMYYSRLINNFEDDFRKDWPEYKFLMKYGFVNDKLQFVNKDGKPVDEDGKELAVLPETDKQEEKAEPEFLPD